MDSRAFVVCVDYINVNEININFLENLSNQ